MRSATVRRVWVSCSWLVLALALPLVAPVIVHAEVIISEIMYNPQGTDLDTTVTPNISREWAELYNTGSSAVDISGWQFGDSQDNDWASAFPAGTIVNAQQALGRHGRYDVI